MIRPHVCLLVGAAVLGCAGPTTPDPDPCAEATVTVTGSRFRLRAWLPTDVPSASADVVVSPASCEIEVVSDAPWLEVSLADGRLTLDGDPETAGVGLHETELVFRLAGTTTTLTTTDVTLSVLERAPEDGERHVLVIGIDGCRPDAIALADAPTFDALTALGRSTYTASTQLTTATVSGPGWASILSGVEAEDHLVAGNDDLVDVALATYPTFLERARLAGHTAGVSAQWAGILALVERDLSARAVTGAPTRVVSAAVALLAAGTDVTFVHFDDVDHAGHASGFSPTNPAYLAAIEGVDGWIASLVDAVLARPSITDERWLVALTTDHGGSISGHGALDAENRTVFLVLADLGGDPVELPATGVSQMDVGPSVLVHLGMTVDPAWGLDGAPR